MAFTLNQYAVDRVANTVTVSGNATEGNASIYLVAKVEDGQKEADAVAAAIADLAKAAKAAVANV
ncbi:hypothetical protein [Jiella marina]|uniref:hypothetical protein n=1 Tax=Jiella sp. LLJ827 TaxID=2917712 RepID=UPI0021018167|nr:hypothetical protein [Jiella sp. LLJ827]MCQ0986023.1 hypothetical protein [Jiella sp. LLJ827]